MAYSRAVSSFCVRLQSLSPKFNTKTSVSLFNDSSSFIKSTSKPQISSSMRRTSRFVTTGIERLDDDDAITYRHCIILLKIRLVDGFSKLGISPSRNFNAFMTLFLTSYTKQSFC
ncbi:hypothetical protein L1987_50099 [Smallanthus sonchifolius]|uniref:Uncharacterized protein n=1 Tax=Smallanthus sonchifolius TaxID=185202 RepID=A0ACB9FXJ4_9ASTR|nr:hypothetical protein L1987_50099 [Smallanthus sonchifolius]